MAVLLQTPDWGGSPTGVADLTRPAELKGVQLEGGENGVSCLMVVLLSGKDDRRHFSKPKKTARERMLHQYDHRDHVKYSYLTLHV